MGIQYRRIRDLREDNDFKQEYVALKLNTTQQTYQRYESGETAMPICQLVKLADLYGVSTDYILGRTDVKKTL